MKTCLTTTALLTIALSLGACSATSEIASNVKTKAASVVSGKTDQKASLALKAAKAARKKAASVGGEWRDIGKIIKKAEKLAENGNTAEAVKWANKARQQGIWGYEQAMAQKTAGPRF